MYIEYYSFYYRSNSYTGSYHVYQRCVENGFDSQYYGKVSNNTTVEFPIGAFAVDDLSSSAPRTSPTSDAKYSSRVHKIVFPEGVLDYKPVVDTWVNIGKGLWEDPWFTMDDAKYKGDINVEKVFSVRMYIDLNLTRVLGSIIMPMYILRIRIKCI